MRRRELQSVDCGGLRHRFGVVRYGIYPLTAYGWVRGLGRAASPAERAESLPASPEPRDLETRRVVNMMCSLKPQPHPPPHPDAPPADLLVRTLAHVSIVLSRRANSDSSLKPRGMSDKRQTRKSSNSRTQIKSKYVLIQDMISLCVKYYNKSLNLYVYYVIKLQILFCKKNYTKIK